MADPAQPAGPARPHTSVMSGSDEAQIVADQSICFVQCLKRLAVKPRQAAIDGADPEHAVAVFGEAIGAVPGTIGGCVGRGLAMGKSKSTVSPGSNPNCAPPILVNGIHIFGGILLRDGIHGPLAAGISV